MKKIIYLDNASTTQCYKEVVKVMNQINIENYGNPSSLHIMGEKALELIMETKRTIAKEINCKPYEIIFTSGGTESNNFALLGTSSANREKKKIIISAIEHSSIYESCMDLKSKGYEIVELRVDKNGFANISELESELDANVLIVSIIHANNEIGVIQNIRKIGELCRRKGVLLHTDAVQSFGKEKINVNDMKIDLLSASGHKINGPKGIGFLYIREGVEIKPLMVGGGQESGFRGGTENTPAIAGFATALKIARKVDNNRIRRIRDYFISELEKIGGKINGGKEKRLANNINVSLVLDAESAVLTLSEKGIMCSTKSACLSKQKKENRVLKALGLNNKEIDGALRFSISAETSEKDVDYVIKEIKKLIL